MHMTADMDHSVSKMVRGSCDSWQAQPGEVGRSPKKARSPQVPWNRQYLAPIVCGGLSLL